MGWITSASAFLPRSLNFVIYEKGYAGGLASATADGLFGYRALRSWAAFGWFGIDDGVKSASHGLVGWLSGCLAGSCRRCAKVRLVKDTVFGPFQLESLILAQNERWRQA